MRFSQENYRLVIHTDVLRVLSNFRQLQKHQTEAGGILLGKIINDEIHIIKASTPTEIDKSTRTSFERHRLSAQIIIDYEFYNSSGQMTYLGEWHTHPEKNPIPSFVDKKMIKQQFFDCKESKDFVLLLIQGTETLYVGIYAGFNLNSAIPLVS